ncbi:hypothetical protein HDU98_000261 [Podochytrium sp. JEL0797]|nr:hypothetical protein HDU98_000261 [Podochytrium sp. JEL0797]
MYAAATGLDPNQTPTISAQTTPIASRESPNIHSSPILNIQARFNSATTPAGSGINEIGIPLIFEPTENSRSAESATRVFTLKQRVSMTLEDDDLQFSDLDSSDTKKFGRTYSLKSPAVGDTLGVANETENGLMEISNGLRTWATTAKLFLTVDNVDAFSKTISITIRRPAYAADGVLVHVNILFQEETPRITSSSSFFHAKNQPPTTPQSKKLTRFPIFEIVRSGMIPMGQRQSLSSRLQTLASFLIARRIPTLEPCMRFLAFDDPNAGLVTSETDYVGGIEGLLGSSSVSSLGGSGGVAVSRNASSVFEEEDGGVRRSGGSSAVRLGDMRTFSSVEEGGGSAGKGLKVLAGSGSHLTGSVSSGGSAMIGGSVTSNDAVGERMLSNNAKIPMTIPGSYGTSSSDDSDERLDIGAGLMKPNRMKDIGVNMGAGMHSNNASNVPFPRLCGATFSMSGKLVCFFSPLPHPTQVKYMAYSLGTRRQQPLFQTHHFSCYPQTLHMFHHFREFLVQQSSGSASTALGGKNSSTAASALVKNAAHRGLFGPQNREDWVGEDEADGDTSLQNLLNQGEYMSTTDLLFRLRSQGVAKAVASTETDKARLSDLMDAVAERTTSIQRDAENQRVKPQTPETTSAFSRLPRITSIQKLTDADGVGSASSSAAVSTTSNLMAISGNVSLSTTPMGSGGAGSALSGQQLTKRPSIFTVGSMESVHGQSLSRVPSTTDVVNPLVQPQPIARSLRARCKSMQVEGTNASAGDSFTSDASSPRLFAGISRKASSTSADMTPSSSYTNSVRKKGEFSWHSGSDITTTATMPPVAHSQGRGGAGPVGEEGGAVDRKGSCGIFVFVKDVRDMLPVSQKLAMEYAINGSDPVTICSTNSQVAAKHQRADLAKLWTITGLILARATQLQTTPEDCEESPDSAREFDFGSLPIPKVVLIPSAPPTFGTFGAKRRASMTLLRRLANDPKAQVLNRRDQLELQRDGTFVTSKESKNEGDQKRNDENGVWSRADWANHPLGRGLVDKMFRYLERIGDVQSLALLSCVLTEPFGCTVDDDAMEHITQSAELVRSPTCMITSSFPSSLPKTAFFTHHNQPLHRRPTKRSSTPNSLLMLLDAQEPVRPPTGKLVAPKRSFMSDGSFSDGKEAVVGLNVGGVSSSRPQRFATQGQHSSPGLAAAAMARKWGDGIKGGSGNMEMGGGGGTGFKLDSLSSTSTLSGGGGRKLAVVIPSRGGGGGGGGVGEISGGGGGGGGGGFPEDSQRSDYMLGLLDPSQRSVLDGYKLQYAEILFAWRLLEKRAEVLGFISKRAAEATFHESMVGNADEGRRRLVVDGRDAAVLSAGSGGRVVAAPLVNGNQMVASCSVCRMPCRGLLTSCIKCGHGGHIQHVQAWFANREGKSRVRECAIGDCGCKCVL